MKRGDMTAFLETHPGTSAFYNPATYRDKQGFDAPPFQ